MNVNQLINKHKGEMLQKWISLIEKYGSAIEKNRMDGAAEYLKALFEEEGFNCELKETGEDKPLALIGVRDCTKNSRPVIFSGHYDTVFKCEEWSSVEMTEGEKLHGPGALDMKGGIIIALFVSRILKELNKDVPLKVIFVGDEEIGHAESSAAQLITDEAEGGALAFNMETGFMNNDVCVGRKGTAIAEIEVKGVRSHPGNAFEKGKNAIAEACRKICEMEKLTDLKEGISVSVNTISGGTASNVIPDYCKVKADLRFSSYDQYRQLKNRIEDICSRNYIEGTETNLDFQEAIMPFECTERELALYEEIKMTAEAIGHRIPGGHKRGGASDAAYLQMAGIPVLCAMGVSGENSHSKEEYALVESLADRTELLVHFLINKAL